jgi:hypothetical protein
VKRIPCLLAAMMAVAAVLRAQTAPEKAELTRLLTEFLAGASRSDAAIHERFWAEDLVYTGSSGRRIGKEELLADVRSAPAPKPGAPATNYAAEDVRIRQYGDAAIVAFRLVATTPTDGKAEVAHYFNTGTFLKRDGRWQGVSWQATRIPPVADEAGPARLAQAWNDAWLKKDVGAVDALMASEYRYVAPDGRVFDRAAMLAIVRSPGYRLDRGTRTEASIIALGERAAAIVDRWQGSGSYEGRPFTDDHRCTLLCVQRGGGWLVAGGHCTAIS